MFFVGGVEGISDLLPDKELENGLHASLAETSLMLALSSDLRMNVRLKTNKDKFLKDGVWKEMSYSMADKRYKQVWSYRR